MKQHAGSGSFTRASLDFFGGFLRDPKSVGSVIPSSGRLERRVVEAADLATARAVVEFGPGTGGTTRALLRAMPSEGRLLALDVDPRFVAQVGAIEDDRLEAVQGSAAELHNILRDRDWPAPDRVVTGIPFSTLPPEVARDVIDHVWQALTPGGTAVRPRLLAADCHHRRRDRHRARAHFLGCAAAAAAGAPAVHPRDPADALRRAQKQARRN